MKLEHMLAWATAEVRVLRFPQAPDSLPVSTKFGTIQLHRAAAKTVTAEKLLLKTYIPKSISKVFSLFVGALGHGALTKPLPRLVSGRGLRGPCSHRAGDVSSISWLMVMVPWASARLALAAQRLDVCVEACVGRRGRWSHGHAPWGRVYLATERCFSESLSETEGR